MFSSMCTIGGRGQPGGCHTPSIGSIRLSRTAILRPVLARRCAARLAGVAASGLLIVLSAGPVVDTEAEPVPDRVSTVVPVCPAEPVPPITGVPWPQVRYDLAALSALEDGAGVTVAVIDSGIDATHPQLRGAVKAGADLLDRGGDGRVDCVGHGTAVASVIAARPVPGVAFRGIAPGVRLLPVRVSERVETDGMISGEGDVSDLAAGIRAAVASQPQPAVINVSLSAPIDHPELRSAVQAALQADIVVVAAVGNHHNQEDRHDQGDPTPYPAAYDGVLGVGAVGPDSLRAPWSQVGPYVDLVAPGDQVVAAAPGGGHLTFQGTSFAVPFVAATAALVRARYPTLGQAEVVQRLLATADPAPDARSSPRYGYGVVNPARALTEIITVGRPESPPAPSPSPSPAPSPAPSLAVIADAAGPANRGAMLPLASAGLLAAVALTVAVIATAVPPGRRRQWRPGGGGWAGRR